MTSSDGELDALFRRIVETEFAGEMDAVLGATGMPTEVGFYPPWQTRSFGDRDNPLRKTWTLAVAATSRAALDARLMRVAEELTAALPESVHSTIVINFQADLMTRSFWRLDLYREENLFLLAAIMTLGGWFAGMTRGRPLLHGTAPLVLTAGAAALHLAPFSRLASGRIVPAGEGKAVVAEQRNAMALLAAKAKSDPEAAALYDWIDACRRLDRAAVDALSKRPLDNSTWEHTAGYWLKFEPLVIVREKDFQLTGGSGTVFNCILMPRSEAREDDLTPRPHPVYGYQQPGNTTVLRVIVSKEGEKWLIQQ